MAMVKEAHGEQKAKALVARTRMETGHPKTEEIGQVIGAWAKVGAMPRDGARTRIMAGLQMAVKEMIKKFLQQRTTLAGGYPRIFCRSNTLRSGFFLS